MSGPTFTVIDGDAIEFVSVDEGIERARRAGTEGRPVAMDLQARAAYLGVTAAERARRLAALEAPDFLLPDLDGKLHRLSDHRGKKVFLITYGSW